MKDIFQYFTKTLKPDEMLTLIEKTIGEFHVHPFKALSLLSKNLNWEIECKGHLTASLGDNEIHTHVLSAQGKKVYAYDINNTNFILTSTEMFDGAFMEKLFVLLETKLINADEDKKNTTLVYLYEDGSVHVAKGILEE